jgi:uncharacterized phiE125 gp8 family phage protein
MLPELIFSPDDPPPDTPISLDLVKAHLRIDHTDEDLTLQLYIDAATEFLGGPSGILGKVLVTQTWRQAYGAFTSPLLLAEFPAPVQSVAAITYYDDANLTQTLDPAVYSYVGNDPRSPLIVLNAGQSWPATYARADAVAVTYLAGYGPPSAVPAPIRRAMLALVGDFYAQREASTDKSFAELPYAVRILLSNYRAPVI